MCLASLGAYARGPYPFTVLDVGIRFRKRIALLAPHLAVKAVSWVIPSSKHASMLAAADV